MKKYLFVIILFISSCYYNSSAQNPENNIYNPYTDAEDQIRKAVLEAKETGKHVLLQVGGNWCPWCLRLHKFIKEDSEIDSLLHTDYVFVLINYSKENKNAEIMKKLEFPQRFGFPVLVVLDEKGRRIHTQNSAYLEKDKSYNRKLIIEFLKQWNKTALNLPKIK
ncbi:thioredoxin family protein [Bacteroidota bacterium]